MSRAIYSENDLANFKSSKTYNDFFKFVKSCSEHLLPFDESIDDSPKVKCVLNFIDKIMQLIDEIPPIKQPMRFGNKAFRTWHTQLITAEIDTFLKELLTDILYAEHSVELSAHLSGSFGNEVRMDYGTGHETNFVIFLYCLFQCDILTKSDRNTIVLKIFKEYLKLMRKLQDIYVLEPAGSHGVWGLDDYHCLLFVWGSAQVSDMIIYYGTCVQFIYNLAVY